MSIGTIYGKDSLNILVTVTDEETGLPLNLAGCTYEVAAKAGVEIIAGVATTHDQSGGKVAVSFAAESFLGKEGTHTLHLRLAKSGEVQTVAVLDFNVSASIVVPTP